MTRQKILDRARDELFSHVNRCGVLQAAPDDQEQWMTETIEYLGERFPDLADGDLVELHAVGIRFCQPAIPHGTKGSLDDPETAEGEVGIDATPVSEEESEPIETGATIDAA